MLKDNKLTINNSIETFNKRELVNTVVFSVLGAVLITLSAQVTINIGLVPITLQTFSVMLLALLTNKKVALISITMYVSEIFMGLPVLSNFQVLTPQSMITFGYIIAFYPLAIGLTKVKANIENYSTVMLLFIGLAINMVVYAIGTIWIGMLTGFSLQIIYATVLPFIIPDLIKIFVALKIAKK